MKIGNLVASTDNENYPLRTPHGWYPKAVVVNLEPLVLVSEDATARWDNFPRKLLKTVGMAGQGPLKLASTRYRNDLLGETIHKLVVEGEEGEMVPREFQYEPNDHRSALQVFNILTEFMEENNSVWTPKPNYIILVDDQRVNNVSLLLNTLMIRKEIPLRVPSDAQFHNKVKIFSLVQVLNDVLEIVAGNTVQ